MSEPTYRVELTHTPDSAFNNVPWQARIFRVADDEYVTSEYGATMQDAVEQAQRWIKRSAEPVQPPQRVFLTEDGDILDPHEVQR